jgi:hypothetical protein
VEEQKRKGRNWLENSAATNMQQPQVDAALDKAIVYSTYDLRNPAFSRSANPDIRFSRSSAAGASPAAPSRLPSIAPFQARMDKVIDSLIYNFQDRFKPLKDIQKRAGIVPEEEDAALAEERLSGTVRARIDEFKASMREPLIAAIHESGTFQAVG